MHDAWCSTTSNSTRSTTVFYIDFTTVGEFSINPSPISILLGFKPPRLMVPAEEHHLAHALGLAGVRGRYYCLDVGIELDAVGNRQLYQGTKSQLPCLTD